MCNVYVWKSEKLDEKSDARHYIKSVKIYVYIYRGREDNINRRLVVATSYRANNSQLKKEMNFYCTRTQLVTLERHRIQTQLFRFRTESHSFSDRIRIFRSMRVSIVGRKKRTEGMQKPGRLGSSRPSLSRYIYIYIYEILRRHAKIPRNFPRAIARAVCNPVCFEGCSRDRRYNGN